MANAVPDASSSELLFEMREDGVAAITFNRYHARNTVSFAMWEAFSRALDRLEGTTPARALVLSGAGGHFGNGGDVKVPPGRGEGALALAARLEMGQRAILRLQALPIPSIAAVEGGAWGISWSIALACDMLFAAEDARFGAPFIDYGLVPDGGAAWFLTRRLGRQRAAEIILANRVLDAREALELGLCSRITPKGETVAQALALGASMGSGNRHAVELAKRLLHRAETTDLGSVHALELAYCHLCQLDEEVPRAREAFKARAAARKAKG